MRGISSPRFLGLTMTLFAAVSPVACGPAAGVWGGSDSAQGWSPAVRGLRLRAQSPNPTYDDLESFILQVVFENVGDTAIGVVPASVRRRYRALGAGRVTYVPLPAPPIYPWRNAFALGPKETRTVTFVGSRDGNAHWNLEPGTYELSVRYIVDEDEEVARPAVPVEVQRELGGAPIWVGALETPTLRITFQPRTN